MQRRQITAEQAHVLGRLAKQVARDGCRFIEVGSWCGDSTVALGEVAREHRGLVYCIDWWKGSPGTELGQVAQREEVLLRFLRRVRQAGLEDVVVPILARSDRAYQMLRRGVFELVFLDADHLYEGTLGDIRQYKTLVRPDGGILCGHDCEGKLDEFDPDLIREGLGQDSFEGIHCGVIRAVGESFADCSVNYGIWSVQVDREGTWHPTDVDLEPYSNDQRCVRSPLGFGRTYEVIRYGPQVFALRHEQAGLDLADEAVRNDPEVLSAPRLEEVLRMTGESVSMAMVPRILERRRRHNLVQYRNLIYAIPCGKDLDFLAMSEEEIALARRELMVSDNLEGARELVDQESIRQGLSRYAKALTQLEDQFRQTQQQLSDLRRRMNEPPLPPSAAPAPQANHPPANDQPGDNAPPEKGPSAETTTEPGSGPQAPSADVAAESGPSASAPGEPTQVTAPEARGSDKPASSHCSPAGKLC